MTREASLVQIAQSESLPARLMSLLEEATATVDASLLAGNTKRAYATDWRMFEQWCADNHVQSLPASPAVLIAYVTDIKDVRSMATLSRYLVSIKTAHTVAGHTSPTTHPAFLTAWKGLRREKGTRQQGAAALRMEDLLACIETHDPTTLMGMRNRALLAIGFLGGFRRGELVGMKVEHLTFEDEGVIVLIPRSKTDQEGAGKEKALPYAEDPRLCAPTLLRDWMSAAHIQRGYLWRSGRGGLWRVDRPISDGAFAKMLKQSLQDAGLDESRYSAHSLRSGIATHLALDGADLRAIQGHLGHATDKMTARYVRIANRWVKNPLKQAIGKENKRQDGVPNDLSDKYGKADGDGKENI